jgi:hypothetical protein
MQRAEVRIIEDQHEELSTPQIASWEKEQLLAKYGYVNQITNQPTYDQFDPTRDLSFEELMKIEDNKYRDEMIRNQKELMNRPKTYSIDSDRVGYKETKWSSMDLNGQDFGIQVHIVSDMKIR